jgi:quercetin dioxygenase-like cupin family protein
VPAHAHPGRQIVFYVVEGEVELTLDGDDHRVTAGDVAQFDGDQDIAPRAVEDSTALIVLAARPDD